MFKLFGMLGKEKWMGYCLILPAVAYIFAFNIYPLCLAMILSFSDSLQLDRGIIEFVGIRNFLTLLSDKRFWESLGHSLYFTFWSIFLHLLVGMGFTLLLNQHLKLRSLWRGLVFLPWLLPAVVVGTLWVLMYQPAFGILNLVLGKLSLGSLVHAWLGEVETVLPAIIVANTWKAYGFATLMLLAGLQTIPYDVYEAAMMDGASSWQRFRYITIPSLMPFILTVLMVDLIWTFSNFDLIYIMTQGGPLRASQVLPIYIYENAFIRDRFDLGSAGGVIMMSIMGIFILIFLRLYHRPAEGS